MAASKQLTDVLSQLRDVTSTLEGAAGDDAKFSEVATDASLLFLNLKASNRDVLEGVEAVREQTASAKKELDEKRLQLQNVLYEKSHIQKEIKTCQDFRSKYTDPQIGLCGVEEFKKQAPGEVATTGGGGGGQVDEHTLMLKRLSHELAERKKLCEQEKELKVREQKEREREVAKSSCDGGGWDREEQQRGGNSLLGKPKKHSLAF